MLKKQTLQLNSLISLDSFYAIKGNCLWKNVIHFKNQETSVVDYHFDDFSNNFVLTL